MRAVERRFLLLAAEGKQAQLDFCAKTLAAVVLDVLREKGLVRLVKHRDFTRTYVLTRAGRAALQAP